MPAERKVRSARSTFGPVLLFGVAAAVLAAVAGAKSWATHDLGGRPGDAFLLGSDLGTMPLAGALGLLLLAAWGVLLVTRGRVRRALAVVALVVSVGLLACVVIGSFTVPGDVRNGYAALKQQGFTVNVHFTGWFWAAGIGALLSVVATILAVRLTPAWPEMGSRYDAPGAARVRETPPADDADTTNLELWNAIDEGDDPTVSR
ncbi:MAG: Trp biosynthesis-associated membrane protein [Actinomycetota bacterium]|nr:Trp biosynthesis-associated membrane protein [Actinomycetota bacterium]